MRSYSAEPVSESQLEYILECARLAPSAVNLQPWRFIVVKSETVRQQVQSCYKREWIAQAPLYIICVVRHQEEWVRRDGKRHGDIDIAIAAEHICMAATEQGLGSCWVCNFRPQVVNEVLGLEGDIYPVAIVPLGYATDTPTLKKRKPLDEILTRI